MLHPTFDPFDPFDPFAMDNSALTSTTPSDVKPESQADAAPKAPSAASHEEKIAQVRELTNATHQAAFQALLTFNWDVQMAVDKILNAHEATKQVLSQRNANPQAKSHHPPPLPVQHVVVPAVPGAVNAVAVGGPTPLPIHRTDSGNADPLEGWVADFLKGFLQGCFGGCVVGICSAFV
mmetsp:Transcript_35005/g.71329  ORF Transcript_35005/g.71329 Transcript_35005/m.71329 type:complete len:179 (-) Transcript_35005:98-634(-)